MEFGFHTLISSKSPMCVLTMDRRYEVGKGLTIHAAKAVSTYRFEFLNDCGNITRIAMIGRWPDELGTGEMRRHAGAGSKPCPCGCLSGASSVSNSPISRSKGINLDRETKRPTWRQACISLITCNLTYCCAFCPTKMRFP